MNSYASICIKCVLFLFVVFQISPGQSLAGIGRNPVEWVNPLMGTDSKFELSNGNQYPVIAMPWGMNFWSPQTGKMGDGWLYQYSADKIRGIKQTHQASVWIGDYGQFSLMPVTGTLKIDEEERASWFSHKAEVVKPHYYRVYLADPDVTAEVTPTERAAKFRFTYPKRSEEHTSELQSLMRISYAVFCLTKQN